MVLMQPGRGHHGQEKSWLTECEPKVGGVKMLTGKKVCVSLSPPHPLRVPHKDLC